MIFRRKKDKGFSFIEVMLAVAILASGVVFVYKGFLTSLNVMNHLVCRFRASNMLNNASINLQDEIQGTKVLNIGEKSEIKKILLGRRMVDFRVDTNVRPAEDLEGLYEVSIALSWKEGAREARLSQGFYIAQYDYSAVAN